MGESIWQRIRNIRKSGSLKKSQPASTLEDDQDPEAVKAAQRKLDEEIKRGTDLSEDEWDALMNEKPKNRMRD